MKLADEIRTLCEDDVYRIVKHTSGNLYLVKDELSSTFNLVRLDGKLVSSSKNGLTDVKPGSIEYTVAVDVFRKKGLL